jgi:3-hydroxyisobutyrate dehydrogenase-like beta-hydroxyacid dehydrogenase
MTSSSASIAPSSTAGHSSSSLLPFRSRPRGESPRQEALRPLAPQPSRAPHDPAKVAVQVALGATAGAPIAATVAGTDVVLTSLPGPDQLAALGLSSDGVIASMRPGAVWADLSTNDLECGRKLLEAARSHGIGLLDCPVTGGTEGAEAGTLLLMVGGDSSVLDQVRPVLNAIGTSELLGTNGAGYTAKISQVTLCYLNSVCLTEALLLGAKGGVDPANMLDIIRNSTGASYVADHYGPAIIAGDDDPSF